MKPWLPAVLLVTAFPAMAQDVAGTLRVRGNVMVSTGGEFVTARDGQPILAGQRILVGDGASATVEYERDCKQSFDTAGVHVIPPGRCDDDDDRDRDEEDRSQERERSTEQGQGQGAEQTAGEQGAVGQGAATASGASTWTSLAVALGGVAATAAAMEEQGDSPPDHPISR